MGIENARGLTFMVTGATGRLGHEIVSRLEEFNARIYPLVLPGYPPTLKRLKWNCNTAAIAVNNSSDLKNLPSPDYLINLHWQVNRNLSFTQQLFFEVDYNIHQLEFLWDWIDGKLHKRFINISSLKIYSPLNSNPITADSEARPMTPYGIAKRAAENFFDARFYKSDFSVVHLRLCSVASYGEHPSHLMSQLVASGFENKRIKINKGHYTNLLYIDDAIDLIINSAFVAKKKHYLLAAERIKNETIAREFERISKTKLNAEFVDFMPGVTDPLFTSNIFELSDEWTRRTSLDMIIKKIIQNAKNENITDNKM